MGTKWPPVTEEVPLSEFVTEEEPDEQEAASSENVDAQDDGAGSAEEGGGETNQPVHPSDVSPMESTSAYDPAGDTCESCGETVQRRFHTDEGLRCLECVSWSEEN